MCSHCAWYVGSASPIRKVPAPTSARTGVTLGDVGLERFLALSRYKLIAWRRDIAWFCFLLIAISGVKIAAHKRPRHWGFPRCEKWYPGYMRDPSGLVSLAELQLFPQTVAFTDGHLPTDFSTPFATAAYGVNQRYQWNVPWKGTNWTDLLPGQITNGISYSFPFWSYSVVTQTSASLQRNISLPDDASPDASPAPKHPGLVEAV